MKPKTPDSGFTLIELVLCLGISVILTVLAIPNFKALSAQFRLEGAIQKMISDLRLARQIAITKRIHVLVRLDPEQERYTLEKQEGSQSSIIFTVDFKNPKEKLQGIDLVGSTKGNLLVFSPRGTTNSWTTITLRNSIGKEKKITLIGTGRVKRKSVDSPS